MPSKLQKWLTSATLIEKKKLALAAGTTLGYLRHVAAGRRFASAEFASKIEKATEKTQSERLPKIIRSDLSTACRNCHYLKKCMASEIKENQ